MHQFIYVVCVVGKIIFGVIPFEVKRNLHCIASSRFGISEWNGV